jgi:acetoacetyl-[acyl-carrier protein] synthase
VHNLPVIVGFGGINSAGRSSGHMAYQRMVFESLSDSKKNETLRSLGLMMGLLTAEKGELFDQQGTKLSLNALQQKLTTDILENTQIRKIHSNAYDPSAVPANKRANLSGQAGALQFVMDKKELPRPIPATWEVKELGDDKVSVSCEELNVLLADTRQLKVSVAGQLPTGLDIGALYPSRNHPKGLEMTVFGASDALGSLGIDIDTIKSLIPADQIGVYACSSMGQLDDNGIVGYSKAAMMGKRATSKQLPLGFPEMPGDFINAYMLGNAGFTGGVVGACASFLYNLEHAVKDIQSGRRHVAIVGVSEAPITPEVMEGYRTMGALAEDSELIELDAHLKLKEPRYSLACRPFGYNCGFTMGESAQFTVLFSAEFALKTGANVLGSVAGVFTHADAFKKSISSPGIGNYLSLGRAVSLAESMLGSKAVQTSSYVHAHGTGTPQNRVTESHVINEIAKAKGISNWPVSSVKCYLGHSLGAAGGDQMMAALGTWNEGIIPGIFSVDEFANDIHDSHLKFSQKNIEVGASGMQVAFLNSKGFGGNNATACLLNPDFTSQALKTLAGKDFKAFQAKQENTFASIDAYKDKLAKGETPLIYKFGEGVLEGKDLKIDSHSVQIPGFGQKVSLQVENPYD